MLVIGNGVNGGIYGTMFPEEELARLDVVSADINGLTEFNRKRMGNYWIDPTFSGLPFLNSAAVDPSESAPI